MKRKKEESQRKKEESLDKRKRKLQKKNDFVKKEEERKRKEEEDRKKKQQQNTESISINESNFWDVNLNVVHGNFRKVARVVKVGKAFTTVDLAEQAELIKSKKQVLTLPFSVENKLDGMRIIVYFWSRPQFFMVQIFSKGKKGSLFKPGKLPRQFDKESIVVKILTPFFKKSFKKFESGILDGEVCVLNMGEELIEKSPGQIFNQLSTPLEGISYTGSCFLRAGNGKWDYHCNGHLTRNGNNVQSVVSSRVNFGKKRIIFFPFDCLGLDGVYLLHLPHFQRRKVIDEKVIENEGVKKAFNIKFDNPLKEYKKFNFVEFLLRFIEIGFEGAILKASTSLAVGNWVKFKNKMCGTFQVIGKTFKNKILVNFYVNKEVKTVGKYLYSEDNREIDRENLKNFHGVILGCKDQNDKFVFIEILEIEKQASRKKFVVDVSEALELYSFSKSNRKITLDEYKQLNFVDNPPESVLFDYEEEKDELFYYWINPDKLEEVHAFKSISVSYLGYIPSWNREYCKFRLDNPSFGFEGVGKKFKDFYEFEEDIGTPESFEDVKSHFLAFLRMRGL